MSYDDIALKEGVPKTSVIRICSCPSGREEAALKVSVEKAKKTSKSSLKRKHAAEEHTIVPIKLGMGCVSLWARSETSDMTSQSELFINKYYRPKDALARQVCGSAAATWSVLDVGANCGYASIFLRREVLCGEIRQHIVVEPGADNLEILVKNLQMCSISARVVRAAVSHKAGVGKLHSSSVYNKYRKTLMPTAKNTSTENVTLIPAADLLNTLNDYKANNIFIKIDCEGGEKFLAAAFGKWLSSLTKTDCVVVVVEVSFDNLDLSFACYEAFKALFRNVRNDWVLMREVWERPPHGAGDNGFERLAANAASRGEMFFVRRSTG